MAARPPARPSSARSPSRAAKAALLLGGVALALVSLEVGLRVVGATRVRAIQNKNIKTRVEQSDVRILCIGESTTAWGYPTQLAKMLRRNPALRFGVFNGGRAAATSVDILGRLDAQIDAYDPHVVVAMVGINDHRLDYAARYPVVRILRNSRVYRLYALLWEHLTGPEVGPLRDRDGEATEVSLPILKEVEALTADGQLDAARALYVEALADYADASREETSEVTFAAIPLSTALHREGRTEEGVALVRQALELPALQNIRRGGLYSHIARLYHQAGNEEASGRALEESVRELRLPLDLDVTRTSYESLRAQLAERGIPLIAVQYPMRDVDELREMYGNPDDLTFVDNGATFETLVDRHGFFGVFKDQFAGDFGHMHKIGKRRLARTVAHAIERDLASGRIQIEREPSAKTPLQKPRPTIHGQASP